MLKDGQRDKESLELDDEAQVRRGRGTSLVSCQSDTNEQRADVLEQPTPRRLHAFTAQQHGWSTASATLQ